VNLAGEADTMAAVAGGAAGAFWGEDAIPARWLEKLHQRDELENVATDLYELRQHLAVYATRGLKAFEYNQLSDQMFAGRNPLTARDVRVLRSLGVTHILDLREPREWSTPKFGAEALHAIESSDIQRINLVVEDMGAPDHKTIDAACDWIDKALRDEDAKVYIHCRAGMERTAAILIAHHVKKNGGSYDEALGALREMRPILNPLPNQEHAVRNWLRNA
jgi:protein-tyrosine phosphatase